MCVSHGSCKRHSKFKFSKTGLILKCAFSFGLSRSLGILVELYILYFYCVSVCVTHVIAGAQVPLCLRQRSGDRFWELVLSPFVGGFRELNSDKHFIHRALWLTQAFEFL